MALQSITARPGAELDPRLTPVIEPMSGSGFRPNNGGDSVAIVPIPVDINGNKMTQEEKDKRNKNLRTAGVVIIIIIVLAFAIRNMPKRK